MKHMGKRGMLLAVIGAMLAALAAPAWAAPTPSPAPPNIGPKAGAITALLPVAKIVRGTGKTSVTSDAKKGDDLVWNDLVKTEKGGRARITLADQSILSLGSQAELRIVRHDAKSQQTSLQMAYGRVRAQVANITRDGGKFELRTPTAVAGVIGTDWGVESSPTSGDTFVCLAGAVQISNIDPSVAGSVQCTAGQTTTVLPGKAPTPPKPASLQQLQQLIEDTEPAMIGSMSPAAALPGSSFDATIAGMKLGKVTGVSVDGASGVAATVKNASDTSITVHIVVEPTATAGPRTVTLAKASGAASATVFTVLGLPVGDPKKAYLDTLDKLRQTGAGGLNAFLSGAQQAADQVAQQITSANLNLPKPLDLTPFATSLNQQYGTVQGGLKGADTSIDKAAQEAANAFSQLYDAAYAGLIKRDPSGNADATFTSELTSAFQQANSILQNAINNSQSGLNGTIQTYGSSLDQLQQAWSKNINQAFLDQQAGPLPRVNALERIVELGANTAFSASANAANSGAGITSYQWTLCDKSYRPATFGQLLDPNATACVPLQGFQATNADFQIATCNLEPGLYYARLAVTDSNSKTSQMDVRLTVLEPSYASPAGVVRNLADAYDALQYSQFIRWFDPSEFNGYTFVAENIRQTMLRLSTMSINLRVSQENISCNEATVRADWQQNYTFQDNPRAVFSQEEQLSARLHRVPGKGWYITDFQGDNGRVQGVPGPQTADTAAPDLVVTNVVIDDTRLDPAQSSPVFPGTHTVTVTVSNTGNAALTQPLPFTMNVTNGQSQQASTFSGTVPAPLAVGQSTTVTARMVFPQAAGGTALSLKVSANPACNPPEQTCGERNNVSFPLQVATKANYVITGVNVVGHSTPYTGSNALQNGESTQLQVTVMNQGTLAPAGAQVFINASCPIQGCALNLTGSAPAPAAGASTVISIPFSVQGFSVASYTGSIALSTDAQLADVGPAAPLPFDVVDFTITPNIQFQPQNILIGGSGDLGVALAVQSPGGTTVPIAITPQTASNLSFLPATQTSSGSNNVSFTANVGGAIASGASTITINATNHGVTKSATFPVNFFSAAFVSTSLFVNDQGNPLAVPVAVGAQAPDNYPTIDLRFAANFVGGPAPLGVVQPTCGNFVIDFPAQTAQANDTATMRLYAAPGNTCPAASRVIITADIPQTFPSLKLPVYTLFVTTKGLPQLAVTAATPARDLSNAPWLSGEGLDWTITVKNSGSGPSTGGEKVTILVSNGEVGHANLPSSIPAGQQATVTVHAILHDIPEAGFIDNFMRVTVEPDSVGDLSPGFNAQLDVFPNVSNWGIQVTSALGGDPASPVQLLVGQLNSGSATIGVKNAGSFNPALSLALVPGVYSQGQLNVPGLTPSTLTAAGTANVNVSFPVGSSPVAGNYFVQVIAQMKDGGVVTAQRQVTIHVQILNVGTSPGTVVLTSDRNNICPSPNGCGGTPATPVQINGPLPENFTLTASLSFCSAGSCPGSADVSFTDPAAITSSPISQTIQVTSPGNTLAGQVKAQPAPDGNFNTGAASVQVSVSAVQAQPFAARQPGPDPVGSNQFTMFYNIGDIFFNSNTCLSIPPQGPKPLDYGPTIDAFSGFNVPTISWEWQDANHAPVGAGPLSFGTASGNSTLSGQSYPLPSFALSNSSNGIDGLQTYYFAVTISNGSATATKYFPVQLDLSQAQTFCPINLGVARALRGGTRIAGSWSKSGLIAAASALPKAVARAAVSTKAPDLRINATDVSFSPSMPKNGDTVSIRFRVTNLGDADAKEVPIALQVNGVTVAQDTFDVATGRTTLGGLEWASAKIPAAASVPSGTAAVSRASRGGRAELPGTIPANQLRAQLVIDPQHTIIQKSAVAKSAPLAHFAVRDPASDAATAASVTQQRVVLQLAEGGCAGLKFALGAGGCSGDVTITVEDLAKGTYKLEAMNGIADLGVNNTQTANALYNMNALGQSGHTYAVQLKGGKVGLLTMTAVRNPDQLSEAAKRIFRGQAMRAVRSLGGTTGAPETGDTAPKSDSYVYFDITFEGM